MCSIAFNAWSYRGVPYKLEMRKMGLPTVSSTLRSFIRGPRYARAPSKAKGKLEQQMLSTQGLYGENEFESPKFKYFLFQRKSALR